MILDVPLNRRVVASSREGTLAILWLQLREAFNMKLGSKSGTKKTGPLADIPEVAFAHHGILQVSVPVYRNPSRISTGH